MMERKNTGKHRNTVTLEDKMNAIKKCFTSETKILGLENKNISQIELYDKVYSFDEEKNKIELKQVVNLFKHKTNSTIELFLSNGEKISTTKEHKFYIQNKSKLLSLHHLIQFYSFFSKIYCTNIPSKIQV